MKKTAVTIVTGFLGSGKTTLVNKALRDPRLRNTVVIVNEFGDVGIDHDLIEASDDSVILLPNGCLCCAVKSDLITTLIDLHQKRSGGNVAAFDRVIIETSGLAEPTAVLDVLASHPAVSALYTAAGVVATVDAINGASTLDAHETSLRQIALADRILITKTDLIGSRSALDGLRTRLSRINPDATFVDGAASVDSGAVLYFDAASKRAGARDFSDKALHRHAHPHQHERIHRFCLVREEPLAFDTLRLFIDALSVTAGPNLLRVKGIINVAEDSDRPAVIHGAQSLIHKLDWLDHWPSEDRRTRIMFITLDVDATSMGDILSDVERLSHRTRRARERANQA
ncbi:MAG: GTP-binding protein [Telluria sp.]